MGYANILFNKIEQLIIHYEYTKETVYQTRSSDADNQQPNKSIFSLSAVRTTLVIYKMFMVMVFSMDKDVEKTS